LEYNGSWLRHHHTYDAITQIIYPEQTENSYLNGISPLNMVINYHNGSFNYHLNTDNKGSSFEILSDYTNNDYQFRTNNNSKFYDYQHNYVSDTTFGTNTPSPSHIFTTDMHYQDNFSKNSSLMLGGKLTLVNIDNSSQNYIVQDDVKSDNSALDFKYKYKEKTYAGYVNYNTNFWNTEAQFGLRGEYTHVDGTLTQVNNNQYNPYHYFNLFPTVFLKKSIGSTKDNAFSFTYGRRIQRPSFSDLNPYRFYVDFYTIAEGNPYLRPSIINSLELAYTFKSEYSASIFYNKQDKMIGEYWTTDASTLNSIDSRQNFGNRYNYGGELAIPIKITKWWNMDNDFTINHIEVRMQAIDVKATPVTIKTMNSLKIDKTTNFTLQFIYVSKNQFGNAITNGYSTFNMGIQKKILKNKLIINLNGEDVFNMIRMKTISYTPTSNIYFSSKRQWQTISLSLIYNFNLGKNNIVRKLKSSSSDEKARM
jgi:iron complex outermembrane recepter protein